MLDLLSIPTGLTGVPGCAPICGHRLRLIRATTDALPRRTAIHRAVRTCSTRSLQGHTRATAVLLALRATALLAFHSHHQHTLPVLQFTGSSPPFSTTANPNSSSTGTPTHTPQPSLHNHQSISLTSSGTHPATNTQSANPTTPLKPRPDRPIQPSRPNTLTNYR